MTHIIRFLNLLILTLGFVLFIFAFPLLNSKITNTPLYVHPDFQPYLESFKRDAALYKSDVDFYKMVTVFSDVGQDSAAAYCLPATKTIVVSTRTWNSIDDKTRKALLYHEWGHCLLKREHVEDINYYTLCPESVMYPYIDPLQRCYSRYESSYNKELFTNPYNYKTFARRKK